MEPSRFRIKSTLINLSLSGKQKTYNWTNWTRYTFPCPPYIILNIKQWSNGPIGPVQKDQKFYTSIIPLIFFSFLTSLLKIFQLFVNSIYWSNWTNFWTTLIYTYKGGIPLFPSESIHGPKWSKHGPTKMDQRRNIQQITKPRRKTPQFLTRDSGFNETKRVKN